MFAGAEKLLKLSLSLFSHQEIKEKEVLIDTTVQEKNIIFPTDTKLHTIRTAAATAAEDEPDTEKMGIDMKLFSAWTRGFLSEAGDILTATEKQWLAFAPRLITYEQALRFLTDYIDGDRYYKTHFEGHNLQRARAQIKLLESMEENAAAMEGVVAGA